MDWDNKSDEERSAVDEHPSDSYEYFSDVEIDSDLESRLYSHVYHGQQSGAKNVGIADALPGERVRVTQFTGPALSDRKARLRKSTSEKEESDESNTEILVIEEKHEPKVSVLGKVLKKLKTNLKSKTILKKKDNSKKVDAQKTVLKIKTKRVAVLERETGGRMNSLKTKDGKKLIKKTESGTSDKLKKSTMAKNLEKSKKISKKKAAQEILRTVKNKLGNKEKTYNAGGSFKAEDELITNIVTSTLPSEITNDRKRRKVQLSSSSSSSVIDCASSSDEERRKPSRANLFIHVSEQVEKTMAGPSSQRTLEEEMVLLSSDNVSSDDSDVCFLDQLPNVKNEWKILDSDLQDVNSKRLRYYSKIECRNCRKRGHMSRECPDPRKIKVCCLCGGERHQAANCPNYRCFVCGQQGHFTKNCYTGVSCSLCNRLGHHDNQCPDGWRSYHSTTTEDQGMGLCTLKPKHLMSCYNCADKGHFGHECKRRRMTRQIMPNNPAISEKFAVRNGLQPVKYNNNAKYRKQHNSNGNNHDDRNRRRSAWSDWAKSKIPKHRRF